MSSALRTAGRILLLLALAACAYAPLYDAGFLPEDLPVLSDASRGAWPQAEDGAHAASFAGWSADGARRPLATLSLSLSSRAWTQHGLWSDASLRWLRAENLALLACAAFAAGACARRLLLPWVGSEATRAAAFASALVFVCHPLSLSAVVHPGARGDLLALLFGCCAAAAFLRARQQRTIGPMLVALGCAIAAGLSSELALLVPPVLAGLEFAAARRNRPLAARVRTSATTLCAFAACVAFEPVLAWLSGATRSAPELMQTLAQLRAPDGFGALASTAVERLGVAIVPSLLREKHGIGLAIAGVALLCALQPALIAARSAPRLWGALLGAWCVASALVVLRTTQVGVSAQDAARAGMLFPAVAVMSIALGIAATALSGLRRTLWPLAVTLAYAVLVHLAARAIPPLSEPWSRLALELRAARAAHAEAAHFLVIDPPRTHSDPAVEERALSLVFDPALCPAPADATASPLANGGSVSVRGLPLSGFFMLVRESAFEGLRREQLVLVFAPQLLRPEASATEPRIALRVAAVESAAAPITWRADARSPLFDVDPLALRAVRWTALTSTSTAQAPRMSWRARADLSDGGSAAGVWVQGEEGLQALFDLGRSFPWLCGKLIRRVWLEQELAQIVSAELRADVPQLAATLEPTQDGDAWRFQPAAADLPRAMHHEVRWTLGLLELESYRFVEFSARASGGSELVFDHAGAFPRALAQRGGGACVWSLDARVGETTIARRAGRMDVAALNPSVAH